MEYDFFNEIWLAYTGRSVEQEVGNRWAEWVHPEDFDNCLKIFTEHFTRRGIFEMG
jgi:PAS domain-containing protein